MRRGVAIACVLLVALNFAAFWYLRDRMSHPPTSSASAQRPTPAATPSADPNAVRGPVLLTGAPDGSVLRLTRGDCTTQEPARAWVSIGYAAPVDIEIPGLVEALAVGRTKAGWWVIGTDDSCEVVAWSSDSLKATDWNDAEIPVDAWYLNPEKPAQVMSPRGPVGVAEDCVVTWVQVVGQQAYAICADGRAFSADRTTREFRPIDGGLDAAALAVGPGDRMAMLTRTATCTAGLRLFEGAQPMNEPCIGNSRAPLGLAWVGKDGKDLVAQLGYELADHTGDTWTPRD